MKGRWRSVFTKALEVSVYKAPAVFAACAAMHNVCMRMGDACPEEVEENVDIGGENDTEPPFQDPEAEQSRERLANQLFCPARCGDHDYHAVI
ncbi:hypothetical protein MRX96_020801 [Rhipicephalus microplus]